MSYLHATRELYRDAALKPDVGLCCTTNPTWQLPGLSIPRIMQEMNYGCGSTVSPQDLTGNPTVLYVGVGGGMELLQFAYFSRRKGGVIGVDVVEEMLEASRANFKIAERENDWFAEEFVELRRGDALSLPLADASVEVAAQNCLFNIFKEADLKRAVAEMYRVLKPGGRLVMSDPVCDVPLGEELRNDDRLRAQCLSGSIPLQDYLKVLADAGFGTLEVRARRLYRVL
ncbi:MAG TPA: methyltransferase domain-containing protein, partial [Robiginitalea sp.]|nr:methyltransferase domain-containing protein [Robiginitalea sp.]